MKPMSNVDVYAISQELQDILKDARMQKAYQPTKDTVLIRFHVTGKGRVDLLMQAGVRVHTTQYPPPNPQVPPSFPMLLRKYLKNATVEEVRQHNFDRILEVVLQKEQRYRLVVELFSPGNIILLDEEDRIMLPLKRRLLRERKLAAHEEYHYPVEKGINPLNMELEDIKNLFSESDSDVIRTLARSGLGGLYAEEVILRSGVDKKKATQELEEKEIENIYSSLLSIFQPLKDNNLHPQIIKGEKEDVLPLDLKSYEGKSNKTFESFNQALDEYYSSKFGQDIKKEHEDIWKVEVGKFEKRLRIQEETLEGFHRTIKESKIKGDLLYSHYQELQTLVDTILSAMEKYSFKEIASTFKKARKSGVKEAQIIESMDKMGVLTLNLEDERVNLDPRLSIPENAEIYYNRGKKAKRKIPGVNIAINRTKKDLEKVKAKRELALERVKIPQKRVKRDLKWFEKMRWFLSSDGHLVIGGRDATTNEMVVKRYLESNDIYLHSDIHGAPSVVVKKGDNDIKDSTIQEAANLAASFSSAWSKGYSSQDVYWVNPDQVSKTPQSGEFVGKGAFIIRGTRNYIRGVPLEVAVGVVDYDGERIMAGPQEAVAKYTDKYIVLKPGFRKKEELSRGIKKHLDRDDLLSLE
ncbi:MAG TPA: ribosome rescue protein RqcH, partial [Methanobacteriaceae archaeon]|nr:ribosome rescue protein RqcH [Methanobacteriaceae archaeon]